jgi:multiple sugar transport system substrate-binding protein
MKNSNFFQYIVIGIFVLFIVVGGILFSTYQSSTSSVSNISITMWGTLSSASFTSFYSNYFSANNLKYNISYSQKDEATFDKELIEALAVGKGPDTIILPLDLIIRYTDKIYHIPYTTLPALTFKQNFIQEGELYLTNDGVLALPFVIDPLVMYWNRDIFNNNSVTKPPATWAEISTLIPKMTKKDNAKNILASTVALGEFRNINNAKDILSALLIQAGTSIITWGKDGLPVNILDQNLGHSVSPARSALAFFTNFSNPSKSDYSWNRSLPNSLEAFTNGDLAMYFGFASEFLKIKNKNPNLNFEVATLPQAVGTSVYGTYGNMLGFAILKKSANPAGAYTVLSALTGATAYPYWKSIFNLPSTRRDILSQFEANATKAVFNKSAIISKGWLDPGQESSGAVFQEMVESYTTGRETLDGAINIASDKLDGLLK